MSRIIDRKRRAAAARLREITYMDVYCDRVRFVFMDAIREAGMSASLDWVITANQIAELIDPVAERDVEGQDADR